jgi:hypothetical protein
VRRKKSWISEQYKGHLIILGLLIIGLLSVTGYFINLVNNSDRKIIQLNFIALLLGLTFEYKRIVLKWTTVLWTALAAFIFSFFAFAKGKNETVYLLDEHLEVWPYYFLGIFILFATIIYFLEGTKKITEGITLLITISINYWIIANGYWYSEYIIVKCLIVLNLIFTAFSIFNSLSYKILGKATRLILSIWTAIITLVLSIDNILKLYKFKDIEHLPNLSSSVIVFFQFFFLGISSIYIAQNIGFIGAYLPGKDYMQNVRDITDEHLKRYSNEQVYISDSIIVIIISLTGFILNYFFNFLPVNFLIWTSVTITPILLYLTHRILG